MLYIVIAVLILVIIFAVWKLNKREYSREELILNVIKWEMESYLNQIFKNSEGRPFTKSELWYIEQHQDYLNLMDLKYIKKEDDMYEVDKKLDTIIINVIHMI